MFEEFRQKLASAERVLEEIEDIKANGYRSSMQTARHFYSSKRLPELFAEFVTAQQFSSKAAAARAYGMSSSSLDRILDGGDISENMLYRIEQAIRIAILSPNLTAEQKSELAARPWRKTKGNKVQAIISNLTVSLGKLIDELQQSNQLGSENSALNSIQKQQLIVTLEAALVALKAPAVNAEQTGGVLRWLGRVFRRGSEKAIEKGVNDALGAVISEGTELIEELASQPGVSDLDKLV